MRLAQHIKEDPVIEQVKNTFLSSIATQPDLLSHFSISDALKKLPALIIQHLACNITQKYLNMAYF
jgi:hypothetical protein